MDAPCLDERFVTPVPAAHTFWPLNLFGPHTGLSATPVPATSEPLFRPLLRVELELQLKHGHLRC
jgi:hypothetical protein